MWTLRSMDSGPSNITWNCSWSGDCRGPDRATVRQTTPTSRLSISGFRSGISARVSPQSPAAATTPVAPISKASVESS